jgi:hypothetical protein
LCSRSDLLAAPPMQLLGVDGQEGAGQAPAAAPAPTAADTLTAIDRIIEIWPHLVGKLPEGKPRYNGHDIGHVVMSTGERLVTRRIMEMKMVRAMIACGIKLPADAHKYKEGETRHIDKDDNAGVERAVTLEQLEQLQEDTELVKEFITKATGKKPPPHEDGLAVADWTGIRLVVQGYRLFGR